MRIVTAGTYLVLVKSQCLINPFNAHMFRQSHGTGDSFKATQLISDGSGVEPTKPEMPQALIEML